MRRVSDISDELLGAWKCGQTPSGVSDIFS